MLEIAILFQQLLASGTHIVAKGLTQEVSPGVVLFFRSLTAAFIYLVWIIFRKKFKVKLERKDWARLFFLGLLNIPINQYLFLVSIELTSPPNVALAYALTPAFVLVIALIFLGEKATWLKTSGIVVAIAGTVIVLFEKGINFSSSTFLGDILGLMASLSWALYTVVGKDFSQKYGATYSTGMAMMAGFLLYLPIYMFLPVHISEQHISPVNWIQIFYLGVITSGLAYAIWYWALRKTEASKLSVFNNLQPIFTTILAVFFFGYDVTLQFVLGGILIIAGVVLTQRG
jgi:RarD protein